MKASLIGDEQSRAQRWKLLSAKFTCGKSKRGERKELDSGSERERTLRRLKVRSVCDGNRKVGYIRSGMYIRKLEGGKYKTESEK